APLVVVRGRPEGCLTCHVAMSGLGKSHDPATIGCASCHLGDAYASDAPRAHAGMVRVPGNLADAPRTCGQTGCHDAIVPRVQRSIMTTFAGVIAVDREAFGEAPNHGAAGPPDITGLGHSAADTHLRQLCASCHLGQPKTEWGPNSEATRGGGCNACHLTYDREAARQLVAYDRIGARPGMTGPTAHPSLTIAIPNDNCFGCHSRSGRISTNYEGWMELRTDPPAAEAHRPIYRQLADGRFFVRAGADVHAEKGMDCIDCHTANETMGKGMAVARKYDQQQVRCEDCHTRQFATVDPRGVDSETEKLLQLRGAVPAAGTRLGTTASGEPLANVWVTGGAGELRRKRTGQSLPLRPPVAACDAGKGHARLSCESCHTAWTPRCASCHTSFNPQAEGFDHLRQEFGPGAWEETAGDYAAAPPTLGIRKVGPGDAASAGVVDTFAPGMIMDLDRNRDPAKKPDVVFRRLYARVAPHTTRREARSCASCHADPVALGYGEGELRYEVSGATGRWRFTPRHAALADGRPADAWIGFLETRTDVASTRPDVRPFTADEQRRILAVGACLTCHAGDSPVMQDALRDFAAAQARHSPRCAMPGWKR
ncbi:MAG TPA: multiheme c-type cytochrome, partial [Opitutaceae bacterium]|nr:multiheme c-type cytochrome [Opitutaceae bacterium]